MRFFLFVQEFILFSYHFTSCTTFTASATSSFTCQTWPHTFTHSSPSSYSPVLGDRRQEVEKRCSAPIFQSVFSSQILHPGAPLTLKCSASGDPMPEIRWFLYSRPLSDHHVEHHREGGSRLEPVDESLMMMSERRKRYRIGDFLDSKGVIISYVNVSSLTSHDGGLYSCQAFSESGSSTHSALIQVYGIPSIHPMDNVTIVTGAKLQVDCPFSGYPIQDIRWQKDGQDLPPSRRIKSYPNGTLTVLDAHLEDEGWYSCQVRSSDGHKASNSLFVDVVEKPVINPFMFTPDLREGMRTSVLCSVLSGESPLTITWYKNDELLNKLHPEAEILTLGEFTSTVRISNVQRIHSGNYTCLANSTKTSSQFTAQMIVQASPKWVLKPNQEYSVLRGKKLVIDCQSEGVPSPTHQWKRSRIFTSPSSEGGGSNTKNHDDDARETGMKEFTGIVSGPHLHVLENGSLAIIDAEKSDEGEYLCESSNGIGSVLTTSTNVKVRSAPSFGKSFEVIKSREGGKAVLTCDVFGDEPIKLIWSKERQVLSNSYSISSKHIIEESTNGNSASTPLGSTSKVDGVTRTSKLFVDNVQVADSSLYICTASNPYGKDQKNFQLVVQGAPQAPSNFVASQVGSRTLQLEWTQLPGTDSNAPIANFIIQFIPINGTWSMARTIVVEKDMNMIKVPGLEPNTSYRFRITAQNMFGKSRPSQEILIKTDGEAPNQAPTNVRIEVLSSRSIRIRWQMVPGSLQFVEGFYIGYKLLNDETTSSGPKKSYSFKTIDVTKEHLTKTDFEVILNDLFRNSRYNIIIQAFNKKGPGPSSDDVIATTSEFDIPGSIDVSVATLDHHSLSISWKGRKGGGGRGSEAADEEEDSSITGYIIKYKNHLDNWEEVKITGRKSSFLLEHLRCGTKYQITVAPFNKVGKADPSPLVTAATAGSVPSAPPFDSLVSSNSTHASLHLSAWSDNGCPILYFVVQYKEHFLSDWIMLSNNIIPEQNKVFISDLVPSTWYDLSMTAHSEAGQSEAHYLFSTLTPAGGTISPLTTTSDGATWTISLYDSVIVAPLICTCFVLIVVFATIGYFMTMANRQVDAENNRNIDHYSTIGSRKMESLSMTSLGAKVADTGGSGCQEHLNLSGPEKNKIYEMVHREAGNGFTSYYSSPFGTNHRGCNVTRSNFGPSNINLQQSSEEMTSSGGVIVRRENLLSQQNIFLERHLQPPASSMADSYSVDVSQQHGHGHNDRSGFCELNLNGDYQVMFTAPNRVGNVLREVDEV